MSFDILCHLIFHVILVISVIIVIIVTKVIIAFLFKLLSRAGVCSKSGRAYSQPDHFFPVFLLMTPLSHTGWVSLEFLSLNSKIEKIVGGGLFPGFLNDGFP